MKTKTEIFRKSNLLITAIMVISSSCIPLKRGVDEAFGFLDEDVSALPLISAVNSQNILEETSTGALAFTINDPDNQLSCLSSVSFSSSNTSVIPNSNITIGGAAPNCTVSATGANNQFGTSTITLEVTDGIGSARTSFAVNVSNVDDAPSIATIADVVTFINNPMSQIDINDISGADVDVDATALTYTCRYDTSVDGTVGTGLGACTALTGLTFNSTQGLIDWTPSSSQSGIYEIEIVSSDGSLTDSDIFLLTVVDETLLIASDGAVNDYFATDVAISENNIIIGASGDDDNGTDSGSAYIFQFNSATGVWDETKLTASDGAASDYFGSSVDVSGNNIIVGAWGDDDNGSNSGSAYLYQFNASTNMWIETKITASDGAADDSFASDVSISGNNILIGAYLDDDSGANSGSAYLFQYDSLLDSWVQSKLLASDGNVEDWFGTSVDIDNQNIIIGAPHDDDSGTSSGSAYLFQYDPSANNWFQKAKLTASDAASGFEFGTDVSVSTNLVAVGSPKDSSNGANSGSVFIYQYNPGTNNWDETKILPTDGGAADSFGTSVELSHSKLTVGAPGDSQLASGAGSAYIFQYSFASDSWHQNKLIAGSGAVSDQFGGAVGISDDKVVISSVGDDNNGSNSGSASVFLLNSLSSAEVKYASSDADIGDTFSAALSSSGNIIVSSSPENTDSGASTGSIYIHHYNPSTGVWDETKITASDAASGDTFGNDVDVSGLNIIVGARGNDDTAADSGSAYIYQYNNSTNLWDETKLVASDAALSDYYGHDVAISGNLAAVCSLEDDDLAANSGSVYIYLFDPSSSTWEETKITPTGGAIDDRFCNQVSISENKILVGNYQDDDTGGSSGSAWLYQFNPTSHGWDETKITASDAAAADEFGYSVAISGNNILVGAPEESSQGASYLYQFNPSTHTWDESIKLTASDIAASDRFAESIKIWGNQLTVGAPNDDDNGADSGSAYVYRFNPTLFNWLESKKTASDGDAGDLFGSNISISGDKLIIGAKEDEDAAGASSGSLYQQEL